MEYIFKALVTKVVDGDTFDATVDLGFKIYKSHRFRLDGIDTPEIWRPKDEKELKRGQEAKLFVEKLILNKEIVLKSSKLGIYGRYNADVSVVVDGEVKNLAELLRENGFEK